MSGRRSESALGWRTSGALFVLSVALGALGLGATWVAVEVVLDGATRVVDPPFALPWLALVPAFGLAFHLSIDFEYRREHRSITFTQLPLALGLVFTPAWQVLLAAGIAITLDSLAFRRLHLQRLLFNVAATLMEAGVAILGVALLAPTGTDLRLGAGLLLGLVVGETVGQFALTLVIRLVGEPVRREELLQLLLTGAVSTLVMTCVAVVAVTSVWTQPYAALVILAIAGALTAAYRQHRRVTDQQQTTAELYDFVKDLGPVDVEDETALQVVERMRVLLHAQHLDLTVTRPRTGAWLRLRARDDAPPTTVPLDVEEVAHGTLGGRSGDPTSGASGRMSTPLTGSNGLLGILTVAERLGDVRDFDMGDLRLLETVATQLTTALERGQLLVDLEEAATTDRLTGLPNLAETTRLVDQLLHDAPSGLALPDGPRVLVAAVAVESFREVNDTLGHLVGDNLLLEVTTRLRAFLAQQGSGGVVGRIGGGRFAVAVPAAAFSGEPEILGLTLRAAVEGPAHLDAIGTHVRLSVGASRGPEHGSDAATLLRRAETAMFSARHQHGGPVVWEPAYELEGARRLTVVTALNDAISQGAIGVAYQPKICARTGAVTGVEALARWTHPALGAVGPDEFVPLAEASGLVGPLTLTVLGQALSAYKGWMRRSGHVGVAVNISAESLLEESFVGQVTALLAEHRLPADVLTLELTEGVVVGDAALAATRMQQLRDLGIRLSVDDFGTGYSSLTYLKGLPVDEVKIDKTFVAGLGTNADPTADPADEAVVRAVVDIAHALGIKVVAEGVEDATQQDALHRLGVDEVQGYLVARPMPSLEMATWLRHGGRERSRGWDRV